MSKNKVIAVVGATGAQGGSLVRSILNNPSSGYSARAITRDANSDKAKELAKLGAEVVQADIEAVESLQKAFSGAYGAFCVTFFWEHFSPEKEKAHAKNMADAAKATGVQHVIWSTLEDTRKWIPLNDDRMPTLGEKYKVPHFDAKGEMDDYFKKLGLPVTFLHTSFYWENLIYFGMGPKKGPDGNYAITMPMGNKKMPGISAEDIGKCAFGIFTSGNGYVGKTVGIAGEHLTGQEMATVLSKALGKDIAYNDVPPEVYRGFGFPGAEDLGNMFQYYRDFDEYFCGHRPVAESRKLNPELLSFEAWLKKHGKRIPLE